MTVSSAPETSRGARAGLTVFADSGLEAHLEGGIGGEVLGVSNMVRWVVAREEERLNKSGVIPRHCDVGDGIEVVFCVCMYVSVCVCSFVIYSILLCLKVLFGCLP